MASKNDSYYFDTFVRAADCSCRAAKLLDATLRGFSTDTLYDKRNAIHAVEHEADGIKHDLMNELLRAFITPIERDDIMALSQNIDDVTDAIDDIAIRMYINNIRRLRPDCLEFSALLVKCCEAMKSMLVEFPHYKKSETLPKLIIEINTLEEAGDKAYITSMHKLHTESTDPFEVISWREIYDCFEKVCDACEHVADVVESTVIENT
ncbi:MAG TPA: DUF47 family protein [Bacillota bacterium]|nr:DUF47 family protein [Bacillota bacterium]